MKVLLNMQNLAVSLSTNNVNYFPPRKTSEKLTAAMNNKR